MQPATPAIGFVYQNQPQVTTFRPETPLEYIQPKVTTYRPRIDLATTPQPHISTYRPHEHTQEPPLDFGQPQPHSHQFYSLGTPTPRSATVHQHHQFPVQPVTAVVNSNFHVTSPAAAPVKFRPGKVQPVTLRPGQVFPVNQEPGQVYSVKQESGQVYSVNQGPSQVIPVTRKPVNQGSHVSQPVQPARPGTSFVYHKQKPGMSLQWDICIVW